MNDLNNLLITLVNSILSGGSTAITAILLIIIGYLIYDRNKLLKEKDALLKKNEEFLIKIIEKYYESRIETTKSNDAIMIVLSQIENKL
jgi:DNA-directed RNA polymerase beta' subunit